MPGGPLKSGSRWEASSGPSWARRLYLTGRGRDLISDTLTREYLGKAGVRRSGGLLQVVSRCHAHARRNSAWRLHVHRSTNTGTGEQTRI